MSNRSDVIPFDSPDIPYTVPDSSPGVSAYKRVDEAGGARVDISYVIPWDRRFDARIALLGNYSCIGEQPATLTRTPPHQLDWDDSDRYTYCVSASQTNQAPIKGVVGDANADYALFQCVYQSLPYLPASDEDVLGEDNPEKLRFVSYPAPKRKTVNLSIKGGAYVWVSDGKDAFDANFINMSETQWPCKLWFWPRGCFPWDVVDDLQDHTNATDFQIGDYFWVAGTRIFTGDVGIEECQLPDGEPGVHVTLWFSSRRHPANAFLRSDKGGSFELVRAKDGSGTLPHPEGDFNRLFTPV